MISHKTQHREPGYKVNGDHLLVANLGSIRSNAENAAPQRVAKGKTVI